MKFKTDATYITKIMAGSPVHSIDWNQVVGSLQPQLFQHHLDIRKQYKDGLLKGKLDNYFELKKIWDGKSRLDWIKRIKSSKNIDECLEQYGSLLNEKYNSKWLTKYYSLFHSQE